VMIPRSTNDPAGHPVRPKRVRWLMNKIAQNAMKWVLMLTFWAVGCKEYSPSYEVAHAASPNGSLEAVLTETNGGATTSFGYEVSVGTMGAKTLTKVASLYGAVRNEQAYGVNLSWSGDHLLRIQYLRAKAIQNVSRSVTVGGQQIDIELQSGVVDPTAPSGGIHYNQSKQSH
jgi:hypothetical protein